MQFSDELWRNIEKIYAAICELPFIRELIDGSLSKEIFHFYLRQDSLYLIDYAKSLAIIASRMPEPENAATFAEFSANALLVERALHKKMLGEKINIKIPPSPTCLAYNNYLLRTASLEPLEVALTAILPCFWIYAEIADFIAKKTSQNNHPYQDWIENYNDPAFQKDTQEVIAITNRFANNTTQAIKDAMREAFIISSRYEWMFWDSAYVMEGWRF